MTKSRFSRIIRIAIVTGAVLNAALVVTSSETAYADIHVHVTWTSVFEDISPVHDLHTAERGTEFYLSTGKSVSFVNKAGVTAGSLGRYSTIDTETKQYKTSISLRNGRAVKFNQFPGFRQYITVSTDSVSSCSAVVKWQPNPGHEFLESTLPDGRKLLFKAHAENILCSIGN